ncbi:MAG TPA: sulfite exporter TauE/SafE family protein, partial [Caulobacteraceae bacterium]|nr:sulfite exporter TauE/SafE family protein [Caulobacteraceae bacterium]
RAGRVKWPCATVFAAAGVAGSFAGSTLARHVDGRQLLLGFAGAMALIAASMLRRPKSHGDPAVTLQPTMVLKLAPVGLVTGFAAGFFGIGGGFLIAPGLMAATGMTLANAAASSLVSVTLFGATTAANYALVGMVDWTLFAALVSGGVIGAVAGGRVAHHLHGQQLLARRLFAGFILAVAAYVAYRSIG